MAKGYKLPYSPYYFQLEKRIVFDAEGAEILVESLDDVANQDILEAATDAAANNENSDVLDQTVKIFLDEVQEAVALPDPEAPASILFVDTTVKDFQQLLQGVEDNVRVVILDPNKDGVQQIAETLAAYRNLESIQILSHGDKGEVTLGNTTLNNSTIKRYIEQLRTWGNSLTGTGDILFYGCNVAEGETGSIFVNRLSEITGADIAASTDLTGNAEKGGDWDLEKTTGEIETARVIKNETVQGYSEVLFTDSSGPNTSFNGGIDLDGANDYLTGSVITNSGANIQTNWTFEVWVNWEGANNASNNQFIFSNGASGADGIHLYLNALGSLRLQALNGGGQQAWFNTNTGLTNDGNWQHVAIVRSDQGGGTSFTNIYLNGVSIGGLTQSAGSFNDTSNIIMPATQSFTIGAASGGVELFMGKMTDARFWAEVRTATQLLNNKDAYISASTTNLLGSWRLDDLSGTTAADSTANSNNLTLTDAAGDNSEWLNFRPTITSSTYDASTGALVVTGTNFSSKSGSTNDIDASMFTFTGEGGSTYTLTDTSNVEIASSTEFTLTLSSTDKAAVNMIVNKDGTSSTSGTTYNLNAAEDWAAGADSSIDVVDTTSAITVSNVTAPVITSTTYNDSTGVLVVTGSNFVNKSGGTNDIDASMFTFTGEGGATYTLTDTSDVEITSGTEFTLTLSSTDKAAANLLLNQNGTSSTDGTTYNLSAAEDWATGAAAAVNVVDTTNAVTASSVPTVSSSTKSVTEDNDLTFSSSDFTSYFSDPDNDSLTKIKISALASNGTLKLNGTAVSVNDEITLANLGNLTYTPDSEYNGTDSFSWKGSDGTVYSASATTITITISNGVPTLSTSTKSVTEDNALAFSSSDFTSKFSDTDSDSLTKIKITALPSNGTLKLSGTAVSVNDEITLANLGNLTYTPDSEYNGTDSFSWNGSDGTVYSASAVTITITISNGVPTISTSTKSGNEDETLAFSSSDFTSYFSDSDGDSLTKIKITALPLNGMLKLSGTAVNVDDEISLANLANLTYKPDPDWFGDDSFQWKAYDGTTYSASATTMTLSIADVGEPVVETTTSTSTSSTSSTSTTSSSTDTYSASTTPASFTPGTTSASFTPGKTSKGSESTTSKTEEYYSSDDSAFDLSLSNLSAEYIEEDLKLKGFRSSTSFGTEPEKIIVANLGADKNEAEGRRQKAETDSGKDSEKTTEQAAGAGDSDENDNTISGTLGNQGNDMDVGNAGGERGQRIEDGGQKAEAEQGSEDGGQRTDQESDDDKKKELDEEKAEEARLVKVVKETGVNKEAEEDEKTEKDGKEKGEKGETKKVKAKDDSDKDEESKTIRVAAARRTPSSTPAPVQGPTGSTTGTVKEKKTEDGEQKADKDEAEKDQGAGDSPSASLRTSGQGSDKTEAEGSRQKAETSGTEKDSESDEPIEVAKNASSEGTTGDTVGDSSGEKSTEQAAGAGGSDENDNTISGELGNQGNNKNVGNAGGDQGKEQGAKDQGSGDSPSASLRTGGQGADKDEAVGSRQKAETSEKPEDGRQKTEDSEKSTEQAVGAGGSDENDNTVSGELGNQGNDKNVGNAGGDQGKEQKADKDEAEDSRQKAEKDQKTVGRKQKEDTIQEVDKDEAKDSEKETEAEDGDQKAVADQGSEDGGQKTEDGEQKGVSSNQESDDEKKKKKEFDEEKAEEVKLSKVVKETGVDKEEEESNDQKTEKTEAEGRRQKAETSEKPEDRRQMTDDSEKTTEQAAGAGGSDENDNTISGELGNQGNDKDVGNAGGDKGKETEAGGSRQKAEDKGEETEQEIVEDEITKTAKLNQELAPSAGVETAKSEAGDKAESAASKKAGEKSEQAGKSAGFGFVGEGEEIGEGSFSEDKTFATKSSVKTGSDGDSNQYTFKEMYADNSIVFKEVEEELDVSIKEKAKNGTVVVNGDGTFTYTPNKGFEGKDNFTYNVGDNQGSEVSVKITIDAKTGNILHRKVSEVVKEKTGGPASAFSTTPSVGSLPAESTPGKTESAASKKAGEKSEQAGKSAGFGFVGEGEEIGEGSFSENKTFATKSSVKTGSDGDSNQYTFKEMYADNSIVFKEVEEELDVSIKEKAKNGTVVVNGDGTFTYTPNKGFEGKDNFTYNVGDNQGSEVSVKITIDAKTGNILHRKVSEVVKEKTGGPASTFSTTPSVGSLPAESTPGKTESTAAKKAGEKSESVFGGEETNIGEGIFSEDKPFTTKATARTDGGGESKEYIFKEMYADNSIVFEEVNDELTVSIIDDAKNGSVTVNGDGTFSYTPQKGFAGKDNFTYRITDDKGTGLTVKITVDAESGNILHKKVSEAVKGDVSELEIETKERFAQFKAESSLTFHEQIEKEGNRFDREVDDLVDIFVNAA